MFRVDLNDALEALQRFRLVHELPVKDIRLQNKRFAVVRVKAERQVAGLERLAVLLQGFRCEVHGFG